MRITNHHNYIFIVVLGLLSSFQALGQQSKKDSLPKLHITYGNKGFEMRSEDNKYLLQIQSRLQFRFATPNDTDPLTLDDFNQDENNLFKINRARLKVGGHAYQPWLKYYWEYDVSQSNLLDWRVMVEKWKWLKLKVGQWKIEYSRERRISSGAQQMVDRSLLNRHFTVDRQQGVELYGRLDGNGMLDFSYWAAMLTGTGRGSRTNDDNNLMYFARLQWNMLGEDLGFKSSDLSIHKTPEAIIAVAAVTNESPYTRFSSSGGGALTGFESMEDGQYRINQLNIESAFVYRGFSWQSEFHQKEIIDHENNDATTNMIGYYAQAGYLAHQALDWWPAPLEIAARYSHYNPDRSILANNLQEASLAFNWFFKGHRNKLTLECSAFDYETPEMKIDNRMRFRLQWDVSF
ncbi:Phosphate-selective porin [Pustulibacterium marinum]|uniref:Phosphate-selective porin n=1 Tax=Pustulibacterium marinum TaxID=1224947 RepID=A0A1I7FV93_9FLAO|nr:porin [Pustulibacterium marinum]SFU40098.1 Phosphate-selective porin [Pustulibacterium marinum]